MESHGSRGSALVADSVPGTTSVASPGESALGVRLHAWAGAPAYRRLAIGIGLAHFAWALSIAWSHPGLRIEPDLIANHLYFDRLVAGDASLGGLWYFPLPKILLVVLLGPLSETGVAVFAAGAAALLAGSLALLVARAFGMVAAVAVALAIALDPMWTALVATASADLFLAAAVAASVAAWTSERTLAAAIALLLAVLVKPPAAAAALPILLDRSHRIGERAAVALAVGLGLVLTVAGYRACLARPEASLQLPLAYAALRGGAPPVSEALHAYVATRIGGDLLPGAWPLAIVGVVSVMLAPSGRGVRQLFGAAVATAAAYVAIAYSSDTFLLARFLWLVQLALVASASLGAIYAARAVARLGWPAQVATAGVLLAVLAGDLVASERGDGGRYAREFEERASAALPFLDRLVAEMGPAERLDVPLWLQPIAIRRLGRGARPESVEAAEVRVHEIEAATRAGIGFDAEWVLFAPTYYETSETKRSVSEAVRCGFDLVATRATPPLHLLHRNPTTPCRSAPAAVAAGAAERSDGARR